MWSVIRSVINNCKPSKLNESFTYNNTVITDKKTVSNKFNDYFVNVGKTLAEQIPKSGPSFRSYLPEANKESIFLTPTDQQEIRNIMLNICWTHEPCYQGHHPFILWLLLRCTSGCQFPKLRGRTHCCDIAQISVSNKIRVWRKKRSLCPT